MTKNLGIVITNELSVAINGINFVIENATQPVITVAIAILIIAFQKALSNNSLFERLCNIYNKTIISAIAPILRRRTTQTAG